MRHAKSDWHADYGSDHDRPLNQRGIESARMMGKVLAAEGQVPDLVVTSTAVRARTTAELAVESGEWKSQILLEPRLYGSGPETAITIASTADVGGQMLVGHQPTWSVLVSLLTGDRVEMKTATVAVIDFDIDRWAELPTAEGKIRHVYQPRAYLGRVPDRD